jgi:hypothetical protein
MSTWSIAKPATGTPGTAGATNVVLSVKTKCSTPVVCAAGTTACGYETFIDLSPYTAVPTAPVTAATTCCKAAEFCFAAEQPRHPAAAGSTGIRADSFSCVSDVVCAAGTTACGKAHDGLVTPPSLTRLRRMTAATTAMRAAVCHVLPAAHAVCG